MQRNALCRSRRELSNAYLLAKFGFATAENEPSKVRAGVGSASAPRLPRRAAGSAVAPYSVGKNFKHPLLGDGCCFTISFANVNEAIDRQQRLETGKNFRCLKKIPRHRVCAQNIDIFSKFDINLSTLVIILQSSAKTHQIADILTDLLLAFCVWSGAKDRKSCRARQIL